MTTNCFEIGVIQAFLDGETSAETTAVMANHFAVCESCAKLLAEAEDQNALVFSLLEREMDVMVPTHRLWNRINDSIVETRSRVSILGRIQALAGFYLASPALASALSLLIVFGIIAAVWNFRQGVDGVETAKSGISTGTAVRQNIRTEGIDAPANGEPAGNPGVTSQTPDSSDSGLEGRETLKAKTSFASYRRASGREAYLPGERGYLAAIADLNDEFQANKQSLLPPSARVAFERDLAVVDDAIRKMRDVVKRSPDNQSARQVLYASYQDKIDLLNSVALRDELAMVK